MLVLTRRAGERIFVGGGIVITVIESGPSRVRLGVEAPPHVPVHREEVLDRIEGGRPLPTGAPTGEELPLFTEYA